MDVHVYFDGVFFVWNSDKAKANEAKHGVSFDRAIHVFSDPLAYYDDASVFEESRTSVIGRDAEGNVLFVVHLLREDDRVRIVSARPAAPKEKRDYEEFG